MDQVLALFLYRYPSPVGSGHFGSHAREFLFDRVLIPVSSHELTL
jgi:hypothetical protein